MGKTNIQNINFFFNILFFLLWTGVGFAQESRLLWTNQGKDNEAIIGRQAIISSDTTGGVIRETDVIEPWFDVYLPEKEKNTRIGVIICPGGGYSHLAINKEGSEIAEWLRDEGYASFVLHYSVPQKRKRALQDLQRTIRMIRVDSIKYGIDKNKIGVMGFSAGADLAAKSSTMYKEQTYDFIDEKDLLSAKPNFTALIYPAYLKSRDGKSLSSVFKISESTPNMFIFQTQDDSYLSSGVLVDALIEKKVPVEFHLLPEGGHGYGLRKGNRAAESWPPLVLNWLKNWNKIEIGE